MTGEEWLVRDEGAYLPGTFEEVGSQFYYTRQPVCVTHPVLNRCKTSGSCHSSQFVKGKYM